MESASACSLSNSRQKALGRISKHGQRTCLTLTSVNPEAAMVPNRLSMWITQSYNESCYVRADDWNRQLLTFINPVDLRWDQWR